MSSKVDPAIDRSVLDELRELQEEGEPDLVEEIVSLFLSSAPEGICEIQASLDRGDPGSLAMAAHSLKSSSAALGAMGLSQLSHDLEVMGRSDDLACATQTLNQLKAEFQHVKASLLEELG